jgi:hypothetical protein
MTAAPERGRLARVREEGGSSHSTVEEDAAAHRASYTTRIEQALRSSDPDRVLEGEIAMAVAGDLIDFNRKVGPNGATGEVDVETTRAIIEVTTRRTGKLKQIQTLLSHPDMNPLGKPVILFATNYGRTATQDIANAGALVVRT